MYYGKVSVNELFFTKQTPFSLKCGSLPVHIKSGILCIAFRPDQVQYAVIFKEAGLVMSIKLATETEAKSWKNSQKGVKQFEDESKQSANQSGNSDIAKKYIEFVNNVKFDYMLDEKHDLNYITNDIYKGYEFAVCEYNGEILYILSNFIDFSHVQTRAIPTKLMELNGGDPVFDSYGNVTINDDQDDYMFPVHTYEGEIWRCTNRDDGAYFMNTRQVMINAREKWYDHVITEIPEEKKRMAIIQYGQLVSVVLDKSGSPVIERVYGDSNGGHNYALCIYNNRLGYIYVDSFHRYDQRLDAMTEGRAAEINYILENGGLMKSQTDELTTQYQGIGYNSEDVINHHNDPESNKQEGFYSVEFTEKNTFKIIGREYIDGTWFYVALYDIDREHKTLYIPVSEFGEDPLKLKSKYSSPRIEKKTVVSDYVYKDDSWKETIKSSDLPDHVEGSFEEAESSIGHNGVYSEYDIDGSGGSGGTYDGTHSRGSSNRLRWYKRKLESGIYADPKKDGSEYLTKYQDIRLPNDDAGEWELLSQAGLYENSFNDETYNDGGRLDDRQIRKINRFRLPSNDSGLSTKSFIFMTRPDLNLYKLDENNNVINGQMHPNLKRISEFKYIGRKKELGSAILDSLEYWGTEYKSPWLSIITNQATGYNIKDRELGTTEIGETFHGHKVIYGKHNFDHQNAGQVDIPFNERRDLSLYYTLKVWTEYIHCLNLGLHEPHPVHVKNGELDYAVSLFYITTNETMEEILYWEKLTGVIPLSCPDSLFSWDISNPGKDLKYSIPFAYSMRSVMKTQDLMELDRLYQKGVSNDTETEIPYDPDYTYDARNLGVVSNMVAYYMDNKTDAEKAEFAKQLMSAGADTSNEFNISKYYYETYRDDYDHEGKFLANWCSAYNMHGIPYVKGPYVVPAYNWNGGKFLLKWV